MFLVSMPDGECRVHAARKDVRCFGEYRSGRVGCSSDQAGLEAAKQGVIFKGKKLSDGDQSLADAGISEGDKEHRAPEEGVIGGRDHFVKFSCRRVDVAQTTTTTTQLTGSPRAELPADALAGMSDEERREYRRCSKTWEDSRG